MAKMGLLFIALFCAVQVSIKYSLKNAKAFSSQFFLDRISKFERFLFVSIMFQLSMAGRIVREADTTESSINVDQVAADIKDKFSAAGESIRGLFTQENFDVSAFHPDQFDRQNPHQP